MLVAYDLRTTPAVQPGRIYRGPQYMFAGYLMVYAEVLAVGAVEARDTIDTVGMVKANGVVPARALNYS